MFFQSGPSNHCAPAMMSVWPSLLTSATATPSEIKSVVSVCFSKATVPPSPFSCAPPVQALAPVAVKPIAKKKYPIWFIIILLFFVVCYTSGNEICQPRQFGVFGQFRSLVGIDSYQRFQRVPYHKRYVLVSAILFTHTQVFHNIPPLFRGHALECRSEVQAHQRRRIALGERRKATACIVWHIVIFCNQLDSPAADILVGMIQEVARLLLPHSVRDMQGLQRSQLARYVGLLVEPLPPA